MFWYGYIYSWVVFQEKFFGNNIFEIWNHLGGQITLFWILITNRCFDMAIYFLKYFFKRNFFAIIFLKFYTTWGSNYTFLDLYYKYVFWYGDILSGIIFQEKFFHINIFDIWQRHRYQITNSCIFKTDHHH